MANFLSQLINNRFIEPAVDASVAKALSDQHPPAFGASTVPELSLSQSIGQTHDFDYTLPYSVSKLNVDVAFGIHTWKGSATSRGWHLDVEDELTAPPPPQARRRLPASECSVGKNRRYKRLPRSIYSSFHLALSRPSVPLFVAAVRVAREHVPRYAVDAAEGQTALRSGLSDGWSRSRCLVRATERHVPLWWGSI